VTRLLGGAASCCAPLFDGPPRLLRVVHRSRSAWQLADDSGRVALCVSDRTAIRLPHAVVVSALLSDLADEPDTVTVGARSLGWLDVEVRVTRWWVPATPSWPELAVRVGDGAATALATGWRDLLGLGEGLTPYGDDVLCGALVTLLAAGHPAGQLLADQVRSADLETATTATSAALLRHAADARCIDELAGFLESYATDPDPGEVARAAGVLSAVGHTSGTGLVEGVRRMVGRADVAPAAAA
jgi:Protein of unknown function (DUF2877)